MNSIFVEKGQIDTGALIKRCSKYTTISFDVFDTLLKRNVDSPNRVFKLLEPYAEEVYGISNFSQIRLDSAREVLRANPYATLEDIYIFISKKFDINLVSLMEREILCEYTLITTNVSIKRVYDYCKTNNKKIIAISDMYLSKKTIIQMLKKCGYDIENVFVSCEEKGGKGDCKLFEIVSQKLNLKKSNWIHIGDSIRGDYVGAKRAGINAYHIPRKIISFNTSKYIDKITECDKYSVVEALVNNKLPEIDSYYKKFGYAIVGPLVYSYVNWLIDQFEQEKLNNVFFLSRDGYLIKQAFDFCNKTKLRSHYLYVSRRSIRIPYALNHHSFEDIIDFLPPTRAYTIRMFLEVLGLIPEKYENLCRKYGFVDLNQEILLSNLKSSREIRELYYAVEKDFLENAKKEYKIFEKYLKQQGIEGKVAIIDIGWNLSMQFFLENMPYYNDEKLKIYGYYLGIVPTARSVSNAKGFICDFEDCTYVESVSSFIGLMESVFLAREGSTLCYKEKTPFVVPELLNYEYNLGDIEYDAFADIQNGVIEYVKDASDISKIFNLAMNGFNAFLPFKSFGTDPYLKDIDMFSKFRYLSEGISYFANAEAISFYVTNIKQLKSYLFSL